MWFFYWAVKIIGQVKLLYYRFGIFTFSVAGYRQDDFSSFCRQNAQINSKRSVKEQISWLIRFIILMANMTEFMTGFFID